MKIHHRLIKFKPLLYFLSILVAVLYLNAFIFPFATLFAQQILHLPNASNLGDNIPQAQGGSTDAQIKNILASIIRNVKYVIGPIAVGLLVYVGLRLVIGQGDENDYTEQKTALTWIMVGLVVISFSGFLGEFLDISGGGLLQDKSVIIRKGQIFDQNLQIAITFIKYILGSIAVGMMILSGFKMIAIAEDEETVGTEKKKIAAGAFALIMVIIADTFINQVIFVVDKTKVPRGGVEPTINLARGMAEVKGVTNFLLKFIAPVTILMLMIGAIMYIISGSDEERRNKGKAVIKNSLIAMAIIFAAYAIVSAFIQGEVKF